MAKMERRQLKTLIETGDYRLEPARVAQAMLRRRAVRELLIGPAALGEAGRIHRAPSSRRQAA
jgi:hypothetical protein